MVAGPARHLKRVSLGLVHRAEQGPRRLDIAVQRGDHGQIADPLIRDPPTSAVVAASNRDTPDLAGKVVQAFLSRPWVRVGRVREQRGNAVRSGLAQPAETLIRRADVADVPLVQAPGLPAVRLDDRVRGRLALLMQPASPHPTVFLGGDVGPGHPKEEKLGGGRLAAESAGKICAPFQQIERRAAHSRGLDGEEVEQRQDGQFQLQQPCRPGDLDGRFQVPIGGCERELGRRAATGARQRLRGANRVGQGAGGPQVVGEAFGDGLVVRMDVFEGVGDAQMQLDGLLPRDGLGDRLADQVVREAPRERVFRLGLQETECLQRFEAFEAVRDVDADRAGEQVEVHVAADDRGHVQQVVSAVVETGHPIADDVSHGGRHPGPVLMRRRRRASRRR